MKKIDISGSLSEIGLQLGEFGREAWHQKLTLTSLWQTVMTMQSSAQTHAMRAAVQTHYPQIWQELEGLAQWLENHHPFDATAAKGIISDKHDAVLPIYRLAADDPDDENTLATAVFTLDANHVRWQIFGINRDAAESQGGSALM
ncbi:hypothetical protein E05_51840 (plasmid) [Plautia stali symbiont]|nr:hypothetical protein E05_51840 [Plautia stali symbiont]